MPIILGDITDQASLDSMAAQSKVVIATAGPFARYGTPVVDACVRSGADYCDITGECLLPVTALAQLQLKSCHNLSKVHEPSLSLQMTTLLTLSNLVAKINHRGVTKQQ